MTSRMLKEQLTYDLVFSGYAGTSSRGALGWSAITVARTSSLTLLFDTGSSGDRSGLLSALKELGVAPCDINLVVLSHLHFDHAANAEMFESSQILVDEAEMRYALRHGASDLGLSRWLTSGLVSSGVQIITGELDLAPGIRVIRTPGHTGGHISLLVESADGVIVFAGDAIKDRSEALNGCSADAFDLSSSRASIERILDLADVVIPGHDAPLRVGSDRSIKPMVRSGISPMSSKYGDSIGRDTQEKE
jgi:N-acyl homoserine lactone hydrolase